MATTRNSTESSSTLGTFVRTTFQGAIFYRLLAVLVFLALWEIASLFFLKNFLPQVGTIAARIWVLYSSGAFFVQLADTLRRVFVGFFFAYTISILLGIWMGMNEKIEKFFEILVLIGISIPGLGFIIVAIIWFGISEVTAYTSVFVLATPLIIFNFWKGSQAIDTDLIEMANAFQASRWMILREVLLPSLVPYMLAAARFGLSASWKVTVLVELLALNSGVGYMINQQFQEYSIVGVMAWMFGFTIVMMAIEFGILKTIERWATKWRSDQRISQPELL